MAIGQQLIALLLLLQIKHLIVDWFWQTPVELRNRRTRGIPGYLTHIRPGPVPAGGFPGWHGGSGAISWTISPIRYGSPWLLYPYPEKAGSPVNRPVVRSLGFVRVSLRSAPNAPTKK